MSFGNYVLSSFCTIVVGTLILCLFTGFLKVFDSVNYGGLIAKLYALGL